MTFRLRAAFVALLAALSLTCCAPRPTRPQTWYADVPRTNITAIELRRTNCFGSCPAYAVRFTADGRATYAGGRHAPRVGRFVGRVDFERVAAWIDSQQPETLADGYATNVIDAPSTTLTVERGAHRKSVTTTNESEIPLRLEGMILALEGVSAQTRWSAIDDLTPYIGIFANGDAQLRIDGDLEQLNVFGTAGTCSPAGSSLGTRRLRSGLEIVCANHTSVLRPVPKGLRAEGDAVRAGTWARITQREADRRAGLIPKPLPS